MNHSCGGIVILPKNASTLSNCSTVLVRGVKNVKSISSGGILGYSFPKGHIETGEDEIDAVKREIDEETGIKPRQYTILTRLPTLTIENRQNRIITLYICIISPDHYLDDNVIRLTPSKLDETVEANWVLIQNIIDGKIPIKSGMEKILLTSYDEIEKCVFL
jgi:8-oxo-dGTP pyrophosphatase MutT (NUDIX family)